MGANGFGKPSRSESEPELEAKVKHLGDFGFLNELLQFLRLHIGLV